MSNAALQPLDLSAGSVMIPVHRPETDDEARYRLLPGAMAEIHRLRALIEAERVAHSMAIAALNTPAPPPPAVADAKPAFPARALGGPRCRVGLVDFR